MRNATKNKLLLITSSLTASRSGIYLGVSAALLLAGCSTSGITNIFSDKRPVQSVEGSRRAPSLNSSVGVPATTAPSEAKNDAKIPPMVTNVSPEQTESALNSPYDQFDASGNEAIVATDKALEPENAPKTSNGNFFSRLFGSDEPVAKEPVEVVQPAPVPYVVRKPFIGNPYSPKTPLQQNSLNVPPLEPQIKEPVKEVVKEPVIADKFEAAITPPPITPVAPVVETTNNIEPLNPVSPVNIVEPAKIAETANAAQPAPQNIAQEASGETLLGRIGSKFDIFDSNEKTQEPAAAYPEISSVPPRPAQFDAIKRDQQQNFNELKLDNNIALQEKESLGREVLGSEPAKATPEPPPVVAPSAQTTPLPAVEEKLHHKDPSEFIVAPLPEPTAPAPVEEKPVSDKQKPYSFDDRAQALPAPTAPAEPVPAEPVPEQQNWQSAPPQPFLESEKTDIKDGDIKEDVQPTVAEEPSLFERIFMTPKEQEASEKAENEKVENPLPVISTPTTSLDEVNIEVLSDSALKDSPTQAQPATEVIGDDAIGDDAMQLPSPDIIKTMRPSRYDVRNSQTSSY